ncbi:MAG: NUDIX hydrolase [Candidatus Aenigmatarchaeota archaeon]
MNGYLDPFGMPLFGLVVRCLIVKNGKLLLIREKAENTWETPGGRVESGEKIEQALRREVLEGTGHEIKLGKLVSVSIGETHAVRDLKKVCVVFEAKLGKKVGEPESAITGMKWFTADEVGKLTPDWHDREAFRLFLEKNG